MASNSYTTPNGSSTNTNSASTFNNAQSNNNNTTAAPVPPPVPTTNSQPTVNSLRIVKLFNNNYYIPPFSAPSSSSGSSTTSCSNNSATTSHYNYFQPSSSNATPTTTSYSYLNSQTSNLNPVRLIYQPPLSSSSVPQLANYYPPSVPNNNFNPIHISKSRNYNNIMNAPAPTNASAFGNSSASSSWTVTSPPPTQPAPLLSPPPSPPQIPRFSKKRGRPKKGANQAVAPVPPVPPIPSPIPQKVRKTREKPASTAVSSNVVPPPATLTATSTATSASYRYLNPMNVLISSLIPAASAPQVLNNTPTTIPSTLPTGVICSRRGMAIRMKSAAIQALASQQLAAARSSYMLESTTTAAPDTSTFIPPPPPSSETPMPPSWTKHYEETISSLSAYQLFPIAPESSEFKAIKELLDPVEVIKVEQIVNPSVWDRFVSERKNLLSTKSDDLTLLANLNLDETALLRCTYNVVNWDKDPSLGDYHYDDNMVLLFHCTRSVASINPILTQGLDERLGNSSGGLLGKGIYFADNPIKCLQYDRGTNIIFVCAVLLGDCLSVDHIPNKNSMVREPEKTNEQKRNHTDHFFDSIVARPAGQNEYVIYNRLQCVPLYQVQYGNSRNTQTQCMMNGLEVDYKLPRARLPSLAWRNGVPAPRDGNWPYYASKVFERMEAKQQVDLDAEKRKKEEEEAEEQRVKAMEKAIEQNVMTLKNLGFYDDYVNRQALEKYDGNLDRAVNYLLDQQNQQQQSFAQRAMAQRSTVVQQAMTEAFTTISTNNNNNNAVFIPVSTASSSTPSTNNNNNNINNNAVSLPPSTVPSSTASSSTATGINFIDLTDSPNSSPRSISDQSATQAQPQPCSSKSIMGIVPSITTNDGSSNKKIKLEEDLQKGMHDFFNDYLNSNCTSGENQDLPDFGLMGLDLSELESFVSKQIVKPTTPPAPVKEDCEICCNEYEVTSLSWVILSCSHKLCRVCYNQIETTRTTMSNQTYTSIRCPFCQGITGIEVGICPDGTMNVTELRASCTGYEGYSTYSLNYNIPSRSFNRTGYIPKTKEGTKVVELLKTAWNRRLCFTVGTSVTTGREHAIVWNIHHKTSMNGGVQKYGYPDPTYLDRVKLELQSYGIE